MWIILWALLMLGFFYVLANLDNWSARFSETPEQKRARARAKAESEYQEWVRTQETRVFPPGCLYPWRGPGNGTCGYHEEDERKCNWEKCPQHREPAWLVAYRARKAKQDASGKPSPPT
jgi:hypothetical protein